MSFDIDSYNVFLHTRRLEQMHRSALPLAIRGALNSAAFDVKKNTMPVKAKNEFESRQSNFFKANSRVEKATGFDTKTMHSTVGFIEGGLKGGSNYAVKDLEQQEHGGTISNKSFIPLDTARTGKNYGKNVKANLRLTNIDRLVKARNQKGNSKAAKFVNAVLRAGVGGFVLGGEHKGQNLVWRVNSLSSNLRTRALDITPLYDYQKGRKVKVKKTSFMKDASLESNKQMEKWYIAEAKKQIRRLQ